MFCPKCGKQLPDTAAFCSGCGHSFAAQQPAQPTQPAATVQPQAPVQPPVQPQVPVQPVYPQPQPAVPGKGMGIASMVLGIVGLVFCCVFYIGIPCSIIAAVLGGIALTKAKQAGLKNGMATAGVVCGCIALGLNLLVIFIGVAAAGSLYSMANSSYYY